MDEKLKALADKIQAETLARIMKSNKQLGFENGEAHLMGLHGESAIITHILPGKKYTKIDVGHSGKYMVVNDTGEIFGIKAYGVIHKGHRYGTLDTINEWHWGEYTAIRKTA